MSFARLPVVPQWNTTINCVSTPDGGLLYIGTKSVNYVEAVKDGSTAPQIKMFNARLPVICIDIDPGWGDKNNKYFASLTSDGAIQIWDFDKGVAVRGHKAHFVLAEHVDDGPVPMQAAGRVLMSYMCNRNVLSMDTTELAVYCVASNSYCRQKMFGALLRPHTLTFLRCSPFNDCIFAVGTKRGLVIVCDIQKKAVMHTLRGHDATISSLFWMPVDALITTRRIVEKPKHDYAQKSAKNKVNSVNGAVAETDIFDIYDYDYLENEFGAPTKTVDKCKANCDFVGTEKPKDCEKFDFAEACQSLKEEIDAKKEDPPEQCDVTLADCQQVVRHSSSSDGGIDCPEDYLERIEGSSSGAEADADGNAHKPTQQILHRAEIHAVETQAQVKNAENGDDNFQNSATQVEKVDENVNANEKTVEFKPSIGSHSDILLASASVDGCCWIWNTSTGSSVCEFKTKGNGKNASIKIAWLDSVNLVVTNKTANVTRCSLAQTGSSLSSYVCKIEKESFAQANIVDIAIVNHSLLWCISYSREITLTDIKDDRLLAKYGCPSINICAIRECPQNMNRIALAFSDRRIGILDVGNITATSVPIENYSTNIGAAVQSLAWNSDGKKLAYGTCEGRVGVLNLEMSKVVPFLYNPFRGDRIYSLNWKDENIFAVCKNVLGVYSGNKKDAHIMNIRNITCVNVQGVNLFAGLQNGCVQLYRRKQNDNISYELLHEIAVMKNYVAEIAINPRANDTLAVVGNTKTIHVLKFDVEKQCLTLTRTLTLTDYKIINLSVKWSVTNPNQLVTCSNTGALRVFDISCEANEEKFLKLFPCPLHCALFCPSDENVLMCCGKSITIEFVDMRTEKSETYSILNAKHALGKTQLGHVSWALSAPETKKSRSSNTQKHLPKKHQDAGDESVVMTRMVKKLKINEGDEAVHHPETQPEVEVETAKESSASISVFIKAPQTVLSLTARELNRNALEKLNYFLTAPHHKVKDASFSLVAKLFGTSAETKTLLDEEMRAVQEGDRGGVANLFACNLTANFKNEVLEAIQGKRLTEWHLSMAPSISYSFWQKCCQAFAEQLLDQGLPIQAATYMIALHKHKTAVKMLMEKNFFKEALLVARIHLQRKDPLIALVIDKWIQHLDTTGNLPGAAYICALTNQLNRAFDTLAKMRNMTPEVERVLNNLKNHERYQI